MNLIPDVMVVRRCAVWTVESPNETRSIASVKQALGNWTDYGRHLANVTKQNSLLSFQWVNIQASNHCEMCRGFSALGRDEIVNYLERYNETTDD